MVYMGPFGPRGMVCVGDDREALACMREITELLISLTYLFVSSNRATLPQGLALWFI
jgi:hypothetical protein